MIDAFMHLSLTGKLRHTRAARRLTDAKRTLGADNFALDMRAMRRRASAVEKGCRVVVELDEGKSIVYIMIFRKAIKYISTAAGKCLFGFCAEQPARQIVIMHAHINKPLAVGLCPRHLCFTLPDWV